MAPSLRSFLSEAHYRYNRIVRLRQAYLDAVKIIQHRQAQGETDIFPCAFSYEEGSDPEHGIPAQERLSFRIWNRRSFVLARRECKFWHYAGGILVIILWMSCRLSPRSTSLLSTKTV